MSLRDLYEKNLRNYEAAHKKWMDTPVHSNDGKQAKEALDKASRRLNLAQDCWNLASK